MLQPVIFLPLIDFPFEELFPFVPLEDLFSLEVFFPLDPLEVLFPVDPLEVLFPFAPLEVLLPFDALEVLFPLVILLFSEAFLFDFEAFLLLDFLATNLAPLPHSMFFIKGSK